MNTVKIVYDEVRDVLNQVSDSDIEESIQTLQTSKRIFVVGEGRSGLVGKCFAMRMMHLGFECYVVGETITPAIKDGDCIVAISGTGNSDYLQSVIAKGTKNAAVILGVTSNPKGFVANNATTVLTVPATTRDDQGNNRHSQQLLGSLFDQSVHLLLDAVCLEISYLIQKSNSDATKTHW